MKIIIFLIMVLMTSYALSQNNLLDQLYQTIDGTNYWRLTKSVTQSEIDRSLFSEQSASEWVRISDHYNNHVFDFSVRVTVDPRWQRIVFADYNRTINSYGDHPGEASFYQPHGICKGRLWFHRYPTFHDYMVRLYIADSGNDRIVELRMWMRVIGTQNGGNDYSVTLEYMREFTGGATFGALNYPKDVTYIETQGGTSYTDDFLWVTDSGNHRLVKIRLSDGQIVESYGEYGSGVGQFIYPSYLSLYQNNSYNTIYIVDPGNDRLVKIKETQNISWEEEVSYTGRNLYGIYADPFGGGFFATDARNHALVRYDNYLREVFAYGSYGLGQIVGKLNTPVDIEGYFIYNIEGSNTSRIYKDLFIATEKWSDGSGQIHYRIQPRYIDNSFTYKGVWKDPGPGGGQGGIRFGPLSQLPKPLDYPNDWLGTRLSYKISDICYMNASIFNSDQSAIVKTIWNHRLTMPGKVVINWDGKDNNGEKYWDPVAYLHIRLESIYDSQRYLNYFLEFYPHQQDEKPQLPLSKISDKDNIPKVFKVFQNYPNPFNSTTIIRYQLPGKGKVTLQIYNVLGQKITTLVNKQQEPGTYTVNWDGKNEHGVMVGSGIYFCRVVYKQNLQHKIKIQINKLLLIK